MSGDYNKGDGGLNEVLPLHKKGGVEKSITQSFEVVLTWGLEILAIQKGVHGLFLPFKRGSGGNKFYPVLRGGCKRFGPASFPFCSPPFL